MPFELASQRGKGISWDRVEEQQQIKRDQAARQAQIERDFQANQAIGRQSFAERLQTDQQNFQARQGDLRRSFEMDRQRLAERGSLMRQMLSSPVASQAFNVPGFQSGLGPQYTGLLQRAGQYFQTAQEKAEKQAAAEYAIKAAGLNKGRFELKFDPNEGKPVMYDTTTGQIANANKAGMFPDLATTLKDKKSWGGLKAYAKSLPPEEQTQFFSHIMTLGTEGQDFIKELRAEMDKRDTTMKQNAPQAAGNTATSSYPQSDLSYEPVRQPQNYIYNMGAVEYPQSGQQPSTYKRWPSEGETIQRKYGLLR
jgi:hypothetical protein